MVLVLGIDEAGRGPVIGSLVIAGAVFNEEDEEVLRARGIKDSKLLSKTKRKELFEYIKKKAVSYRIAILSPEEIDEVLDESHHLNLNWLEAEYSAIMINELKPDTVILDCPTPTCSTYTNYVRDRLDNKKIKIIGEHKADLNYMTCAAASILAKETRELEIDKLKKQIGIDFGSGYQTDPKTQAFLKLHWKTHEGLFRKKWATYKRILKAQGQSSLS